MTYLKGQISGMEERISGMRGQISGLRGQFLCLRVQIPGLRGQIAGLRWQILGFGGLTGNKWTNGWTNKQKTPVFYRTLSPSGPPPKNQNFSIFVIFGQRHRRNLSLRPSVHPSVRPSVPPAPSSGLRLLLGPFQPIFCQIA